MQIDTILILAGGDGDRFAPLSHKMTYRFVGKSLIKHVVEGVSSYAKQIVVVSNEVNQPILKEILKDQSVLFALQKSDKGGMADAVLAASEHILGNLLILNANDLFDFTIIPTLVERTHTSGAQFGFVAKHSKTYFPGGYVRFENDMPVAIVEKPGAGNEPSSYVRLVVDYYTDGKVFVEKLRSMNTSDDQYETAMTSVMQNYPTICFKYDGDWATLKYSWHVLEMQQYAFSHMLTASVNKGGHIHETAAIDGNVYIGKNVTVGAFVKIGGPCYIGDNVVIGDHSLVRSSTLCDNVVVGSGCEVARSYLAEGVMLHRNYVGDSVLGSNSSMGAGAVTANFRFDAQTVQSPVKGAMVDTQKGKLGLIAGDNVKIGVNACTYPGVKLSNGSVVFPGEVVKKDK
jgi:NDP-sugar pyrophosphorylase family protein